ncbi:dihydrofolate reductase [Tersicoccus solisilvae]|uniref:Dihydrofolate reductase n=1 Tax=Tersicoccus solisilvae TaxID=1882339 RepID=A0ABQ1P496_9MICC|nr:dihydrofolate reductase [Tersicoccus solisilvae]GGC86489.1 dihydrofolate reductase [Tersicoccus solisilvae]
MTAVPAATGSTGHHAPPIGLIWAQAHGGVIGRDGGMPWHVPEDLRHFSARTTGHPVIMGRTTWESFPDRFRPLPDRTNIVLTRNPEVDPEGAVVAGDLTTALADAARAPGAERVWVIGGSAVFTEAEPLADVAVVTDLDLDVDGDTVAPELGDGWAAERREPADGSWLTSTGGTRYRFTWYRRGSAPA